MGGAVSGLVSGVGDVVGGLVGGAGDAISGGLDLAKKIEQPVFDNAGLIGGLVGGPAGAMLGSAVQGQLGNRNGSILNALGGAMGASGGTGSYASSFAPTSGSYGGYGPQPIIINNTPGQTATDQSQSLFSQLLPFLMSTGGGLAQGQVNKEAAQTQADALRQAGQLASQQAQFRPVGTTTTFGTSNYQFDPTTGQLTSAGYNLSPQLQAYQNQLMGGGQQSLNDAAALQNLGRGYIAQSPEQAAQQWLSKQQALLQPGRDVESARLANQLQQTGRTGVSVAQGGNLGAANPEQQALANARAMQDLQLAAQAQQAGQQQTAFGQGLLNTAYQPFTAGLNAAQGVEALGQQPFTMSNALAAQQAQSGAQAGRLGLAGNMSAAEAMLKANQVSPFADIMSALGKTPTATSAVGGALGTALGGLFGGNTAQAGQTMIQGGGLSGLGNIFNSDALNFGGYTGGGTNVYNPDAFSLNGDYSGIDTSNINGWW